MDAPWLGWIAWVETFVPWRELLVNTRRALLAGSCLFLVIFLIERHYGKALHYRSRNFFHDLVYWFYQRSDLHRIIFAAAIFALVADHLRVLDLKLLEQVPRPLRWTLYFVTAEFVAYWVHRLQHAVPFLWAFHSVHHAQEQLSFATSLRFHPVDNLVANVIAFVPLMMLGVPPREFLPVYLAMEFLIALSHSQIPWRFGPLYRVVVSPTFHSFHHSEDPAHHDRNYGRLLSVWDFIFGTSVDEKERPKKYGLRDVRMPTLVSQMVMPFQLLWRFYARPKEPVDKMAIGQSAGD